MKGLLYGAMAASAILCTTALAQGRATIAVGEIEYKAMDSGEDKRYRAYGQDPRENTRAFVDMVTTALVKTNKFDVMERDRMNAILEEQGLEIGVFIPDPHGVALDPLVGIFSQNSFAAQCQEQSPRVDKSTGEVQVGSHVGRVYD